MSKATGAIEDEGDEVLLFRVVTPTTTFDRSSCPIITISSSATIQQLHGRIAKCLEVDTTTTHHHHVDSLECNCKLANELSTGPLDPGHFFVIRGKSIVERLQLEHPTAASLRQSLNTHHGHDIDSNKKISLLGAEKDPSDPNIYKKPPVAVLCSKQRHIPVHARAPDIDETGQVKSKVLDLHTSELPIHPACYTCTIADATLHMLAGDDGIVDIFAVRRTIAGGTSDVPPSIGKSSIFRSRAHWEPTVVQSDRGMAMFLSSLRVFTSIVQDTTDDERLKDALFHVFDLLAGQFPPALRCLHILGQGKTPAPAECAALSHVMFQVLDSFIPKAIGTSDHSRAFEGARLFFGFILEMARSLKLPIAEAEPTPDAVDDASTMPYLSAFEVVDLRDHKTSEAVMYALQTTDGLVEATLFDAFLEDGPLFDNHMQSFMSKTDTNCNMVRHALLSGGTAAELTVFSTTKLSNCYRYQDAGNVNAAFELEQLSELGHLAELCGRNNLAVCKPSLLASAVAPCLTFDRNAHLAVYTGEQPCGLPGKSSLLFRPQHGEDRIDVAVIEQLVAPLLQGYEADGTAVFDALGGASVRRLQSPDEIVMFCVDSSASMGEPTDFDEVNDDSSTAEDDPQIQTARLVEPELHARVSFDDVKEFLVNYESFGDMLAIVSNGGQATRQVLEILSMMLSTEISALSKTLAKRSHWRHGRRAPVPDDLVADLDTLKKAWCGLKTHEKQVGDFLEYRATFPSSAMTQRWTWSLGNPVPNVALSQQIPTLSDDVTSLPDGIACPISQLPMEDAVTAADGQTYSQTAITRWFTIRKSSPLHGTQLDDSSLHVHRGTRIAVADWIDGNDITGSRGGIKVTFDTRIGSFQRTISASTTVKDLYKLAFRGLKAKFMVFQLSTEEMGPLPEDNQRTASSCLIREGHHIAVRIADDGPASTPTGDGVRPAGPSYSMCLVKVFSSSFQEVLFSYWVKKDTTQSMASVLWKYWRHCADTHRHISPAMKQVWTHMTLKGDGLARGHPQDNAGKLAAHFTRGECFGHLASEALYRDDNEGDGQDDDLQPKPLVLKLLITTRNKARRKDLKLSRLDVLKQMLEALINRMLAYNYKTHVGLISFSSQARVAMPISHVLENFRRATTDMEPDGDTALWDSLALASDQLQQYAAKYPNAKQRIICISDGIDTKSLVNTSHDICWDLLRKDIVVDSVCLGEVNNDELRTLSYLLGGYRFHPTSLVNALTICEMEPFLSLSERPAIATPVRIPRHPLQFRGRFKSAVSSASPTTVTDDSIPGRKEHPNLQDGFIELTAATARRHSTNGDTGGGNASTMRVRRIMNEMASVVSRSVAASGSSQPRTSYDIYVSEADMSFWKVAMSGPEGSPYAEGTFMLYLDADEGYPTFAPKARFVTKIKHPNVNPHGRICHSIFGRDWTTDVGMTALLDTIYGLLFQPEHSDPVNTLSTLSYHYDEVEFSDEVREYVRKHALKTRAEWKAELLGSEEGGEDLTSSFVARRRR